jgi:hypothetical protein
MKAILTTSVNLPIALAPLWRHNQRRILKLTIRMLRIQMRLHPPRRGVTRAYNTPGMNCSIVTTRFTEAEYDSLHFVAASLRVSVSCLICRLIALWLKPNRRAQLNRFVTNYDLYEVNWGKNSGILNEYLIFWPKIPNTKRDFHKTEEYLLQ